MAFMRKAITKVMAARKGARNTELETTALETVPKPTYRDVLLARRTEVLEQLGAQYDNVSKPGRVAEDDQATLSHEEFLNVRLNSLDYERLKMIDEALDRVQAGDYGICQRCEEPIPARRLEVLPWAKYCVGCQEKISRRQEAEQEESAFASHTSR